MTARTPTPQDLKRWADIRHRSAQALTEIRNQGDTGNALDTIAWLAGHEPEGYNDPELRRLIETAVTDQRATWAEVTAALGRPPEHKGRVIAKHVGWRKRQDVHKPETDSQDA